jgi:P4 family phage/plasmid primase-like protien
MSAASNHFEPLQITFFPDFAAATKREEAICLPELADRINTTSAASKDKLPWLKLGTFGEARSGKNSLRHNANVRTITGVEGDYDGDNMSFAEAVKILRQAGVTAIVYTSPSHTEAAPRWRVLCRFSKPMPPAHRDLYMARLNGLFGGIFARESWTLSQSYYFGCIDHNPDHRAETIEGTPIDLVDELDAGAIGRPANAKAGNGSATERPVGSGGGAYVPISDARMEGFRLAVLGNLRLHATDGQKHDALLRAARTLGGIQAAAGFTDAEAVQWLMDALPASVLDWEAARKTALWGLEQGRQRPIKLQDRPRPGRSHAPPEPPPAGSEDDYGTDREDEEPQPHKSAKTAKPRSDAADSDGLVTEGSVADAFTREHHATLRYCHHAGAWFQWTGAIWQKEETRLAYRWAHQLARDLAKDTENAKAIVQAGKASFAAGVERIAQSDRAFAVTSAIWDADPWLLGTPGGTVDLRTGELRAAQQAEHITKATAVAPADRTDCPQWLAFLEQATGNDPALVGFLRCWFGYTLTGITREHALLFVFGDGGNGKGVCLNTVAGIMGAYAVNAAMDTFTVTRGDKHPTDMAMLAGARMVMTTEVDEGQVWAEARLKSLTGGDPITARFMRRNFFTFMPAFKLTMSGNNKPALKNVDDAARRRINLTPFTHKPTSPDKMLSDKLKAEWPGILRWMIDGCLEWQRDGLQQPDVVKLATEEYFEAQDIFRAWMAERCIRLPTLQTKPGVLLGDFNAWAEKNGEAHTTRNCFRGWIERQDKVRYKIVKGLDWVEGLGLKPDHPPRGGSQGADGCPR